MWHVCVCVFVRSNSCLCFVVCLSVETHGFKFQQCLFSMSRIQIGGCWRSPKKLPNVWNFLEISNEHPLFFQGFAIKVSKHINFKNDGKAQKKIGVFVEWCDVKKGGWKKETPFARRQLQVGCWVIPGCFLRHVWQLTKFRDLRFFKV